MLCSILVHVKGLQSLKALCPHKMDLLFPTENTDPGLESILYFRNLCASLCNSNYENYSMYPNIIIYIKLAY